MPLITFPNVPVALGVPDVNRLAGNAISNAVSASGLLDVLATADGFGLQQEPEVIWQILAADGGLLIEPDSVISFEYRNEQKVVSHPIERGSFSDFNKVATPFDIRMRMTCGGQGPMSRDQFLAQLGAMVDSIELCSIVTPDAAYDSVNMVHWDYRRDSRNGVTLLTVDAWFEEIRETAEVGYSNTAAPSGADTKSGGVVNPGPPSPEVQAAVAQAGVN